MCVCVSVCVCVCVCKLKQNNDNYSYFFPSFILFYPSTVGLVDINDIKDTHSLIYTALQMLFQLAH